MAIPFPDDFRWGTATSSYQIEGAVREGGRGPSIWDTFSHASGNTEDGGTGDVACDHYHQWPEDIALMADLGVDSYRFSMAWPRVLPEGHGSVNEAGLGFYDRLVDGLLEAGITPFVTLYHWDLPQALQEEGGWAQRGVVDAFAEYAQVVGERLGDRVQHWITHNEPWVAAFLGHYFGIHAPGVENLETALQVSHHLLVSHGRAVQALRSERSDAQVGITLNLTSVRPANDASDDAEAVDAEAVRYADGFQNRWFLDPLYGRGYPDDMCALYDDQMPQVELGDLDTAAAATDFLGVNYYRPQWVQPDPDDPVRFSSLDAEALAERGFTITEMGWPVDASGLHELLLRLDDDYAPGALYITENGAAFPDAPPGDEGTVDDPQRVAYYESHLQAAARAIEDGAPLAGYFAWSLLDNFEWERGYTKRFGLVYVDFETQERTPKASARWYRSVIESNAVSS